MIPRILTMISRARENRVWSWWNLPRNMLLSRDALQHRTNFHGIVPVCWRSTQGLLNKLPVGIVNCQPKKSPATWGSARSGFGFPDSLTVSVFIKTLNLLVVSTNGTNSMGIIPSLVKQYCKRPTKYYMVNTQHRYGQPYRMGPPSYKLVYKPL